MSAIAEKISDWTSKGVELWEAGASLGYDAPPGILTPELIAEIRSRELEIVAFLRGERARQARNLSPRPPGNDTDLPASSTETVWWASIHAGYDKSSATDMVLAMNVKGLLSVDALAEAVEELGCRHETFRTRYFMSDKGLRRTIDRTSRLTLKKVDLGAMPRDAREAGIAQCIAEEANRPFDLGSDHLIRAVLIADTAERHVLAILVHHLVFDASSALILVEDLLEIYQHIASGKPARGGARGLQYADYALWEAGFVESRRRSLAHYWNARLDGRKDWSLPQDVPGNVFAPAPCHRYFADVPKSLSDALAAYATRKKATLYVALLAALKAALHAWTGETDISVMSITSARRHPSLRRVIGHFAYHAIIRTDLSADPTLSEMVDRLRSGYLQDISFLPFDARLRKGRPPPVVVNLFPEALPLGEELEVGNLRIGLYPLELPSPPAPMLPVTVDMEAHKSGVRLRVRYNGALFHERTIAALIKVMLDAQEALVKNDAARLSSITW